MLNGWYYDKTAFVGHFCFIWQSGIWEASQGVSEGGATTSETTIGHVIQAAAQPKSQPWSTTDMRGNWGGGRSEGILIFSYQDMMPFTRTQNFIDQIIVQI